MIAVVAGAGYYPQLILVLARIFSVGCQIAANGNDSSLKMAEMESNQFIPLHAVKSLLQGWPYQMWMAKDCDRNNWRENPHTVAQVDRNSQFSHSMWDVELRQILEYQRN